MGLVGLPGPLDPLEKQGSRAALMHLAGGLKAAGFFLSSEKACRGNLLFLRLCQDEPKTRSGRMMDKFLAIPGDKIEQGIPVTFPIGKNAVSWNLRVLRHLHDEEAATYQGLDLSAEGLGELLWKDHENGQPVKCGVFVRHMAYVMTVCGLDGILSMSFGHFLKALSLGGVRGHFPSKADVSRSLGDRRKEIADPLLLRNKVFAHTSYAHPQADSRTLQYTSLFYSGMNLISLGKQCLGVGGGQVIVDKGEIQIPSFKIVESHPTIEAHYREWEKMFTQVVDRIDSTELKMRIEAVPLLSLLK